MGSSTGFISPLLVIAILIAAFPKALDLVTRKAYPTHERGAILITGASTGIGRHAVETLASEGKWVVYAGVRKQADVDSLAATKIPNLRPVILDVASEDSMSKAHQLILSEVQKEGLPFVGLVNNAGLSTNVPVEFLPIDKMRNIFDVNVFGVTRLTQLFLPTLRQTKGRVIQISSVLGKTTYPTRSAYCASKYALEALTDVLRQEMLPFNVSVSSIEPAYVATAIFKKVVDEVKELVTDEARAVYGEHFYREDQLNKRKSQLAKASTPEVTTDAIRHALENTYPKTHYVVANVAGFDAWYVVFLSWLLPVRVHDYVISKAF